MAHHHDGGGGGGALQALTDLGRSLGAVDADAAQSRPRDAQRGVLYEELNDRAKQEYNGEAYYVQLVGRVLHALKNVLKSSEAGFKVTRDFVLSYHEAEEFFAVLFEITFKDPNDPTLKPPGQWIDTLTKTLFFVSVVPSKRSPDTVFTIVVDGRRAEPPAWKKDAATRVRALTVGGMAGVDSALTETVAAFRHKGAVHRDSSQVTRAVLPPSPVQTKLSFAPIPGGGQKRAREETSAAAATAPLPLSLHPPEGQQQPLSKHQRTSFDKDLLVLGNVALSETDEANEAGVRILNAIEKMPPDQAFVRAYRGAIAEFCGWLRRALQGEVKTKLQPSAMRVFLDLAETCALVTYPEHSLESLVRITRPATKLGKCELTGRTPASVNDLCNVTCGTRVFTVLADKKDTMVTLSHAFALIALIHDSSAHQRLKEMFPDGAITVILATMRYTQNIMARKD